MPSGAGRSFSRPQTPGAGSAGLASRRHGCAGDEVSLGAPAALRPDETFRALGRRALCGRMILDAPPFRPHCARKARSSSPTGCAMARSSTSQMITRGGASRKVAPAK